MKDMTSVATTMMTEEEKAEIEKHLNDGSTGPQTPSVAAGSHPRPDSAHGAPAAASSTSRPSSPPSGQAQDTTSVPPTPSATTRPDVTAVVSHGEKDNASVTSPSPSEKREKEKEAARKRNKVTLEQREKLREQEKERRKVMEARVSMLTSKMIERLRPFVEAKNPGDKEDPETVAFESKMKREAEDLKLESFGVEVRNICFADRTVH